MKNVHIIPTDKPSRLWTNNLRRRLELDEFPEQHPTNIAKHIYITSNEEIKEGDWHFKNDKMVTKSHIIDDTCKKIILTTDQDLIKDGVQAIDDEFLEWFVKNPSCEEVEVGYGWIRLTETDNEGYWVSIPNKQFEMQQEEPNPFELPKVLPDDVFYESLEPKQETLEEAAEKHLQKWRLLNNIHLSNVLHAERCKNDFIAGANWQQEQILQFLYSEITERRPYSSSRMCEEVIKFIEQFKKKLWKSKQQ